MRRERRVVRRQGEKGEGLWEEREGLEEVRGGPEGMKIKCQVDTQGGELGRK